LDAEPLRAGASIVTFTRFYAGKSQHGTNRGNAVGRTGTKGLLIVDFRLPTKKKLNLSLNQQISNFSVPEVSDSGENHG
jgi:hypothetical protein